MTSKYHKYSFGDPEWDIICEDPEVVGTTPEEDEDGPVDIRALRVFMSKVVSDMMKAKLPFVDQGLRVTDHDIAVNGGNITVRAYIPEAGANETFALMLWMHGGGYMAGDRETDDLDLRSYCVSENIVIVSVDYRLAPEHLFPTAVNDCYEALKWVLRKATTLSADPAKGLIIAGLSAGGNLAAVLPVIARDDPLFTTPITGQFLQMPLICHKDEYPDRFKADLHSIDDLADSPFLTRLALNKTCKTVKIDTKSPLFSPLLAASHKGLPKTYFQICGRDPLRDEDIAYAQILQENGVEVRMEIYTGCPHIFHYVDASTQAAKKFRNDTRFGIRWILGRS
ncbi:hypothetical protein SISSUDRAFT_1052467 [Sistotremastrum suecicum HHB10207 ss-3]|uniref:Alpha/beta hydrolase fold-3 domain-containing protein n=1 Tax=Sistotremastrum suecicum HHB10207 ss-3 TaxID=1314776 RepID=A0A165ZV42_9AGAM|nr:hypothetical protein SISSUDRAFT_1052467 [Sistotremastrum suecicum HHB10207 ss-3]